MYVARTFRMSAAAVAAVLTVGTVGATAAQARPARPGVVMDVAASVTPHTGSYTVHASWHAVAHATEYRASISRSGTVLASNNKLTDTSWNPTVTTGFGDVKLSVAAVVGHRKGKATTIVVHLPDVTAPTGTFVTSKDEASKIGTITQTALNDNAGTAGITRTFDWDDGTVVNLTPLDSSTEITHPYALMGRYAPKVTLTDASDNSVTYTLDAIVLGDVTAPDGPVAVSPSAAWTSFTRVAATPGTLSDDVSPQENIAVHVNWGDGTSSDSAGTATLHHVYASAGTYVVARTIKDEAGNPKVLPDSSVVVTDDTTAPRVRLTLPRAKHSVRAWKTLRGKATDAQTGVKSVRLKAVEKRGGSWFGYKATTRSWVKAATKARAFTRARAFTLKTDRISHRWNAKLAKLRKGTLVYKVQATNGVNHRSSTATHKASLTRA